MTFFFDNTLAPNIVRMIGAFEEITTIALRDLFSENAKDEDWLPTVGKKGWILVTADRQIREKPPPAEVTPAAQNHCRVPAQNGS